LTAAQIIREARLKAELTQSQLAERLGRERAQVARWEIGGREPSFENVVAVVEACGFALNVEIAERVDDDPCLDAELTESLLQAPQQRAQAMIQRLGGT
jgi:transcriptional regulator with XRE-family HTH domain